MLMSIKKLSSEMDMVDTNQPPFIGISWPVIRSKRPLVLPLVGPAGLFRQQGLTLIELMTVLVIGGILMGVAIPSLRTFIQNNRMVAHTNDFIADLSFARSEAIKRGRDITICKADPNAASPTCSNAGNNWSGGWVVFIEPPSPAVKGTIDAGEEILRIHERLSGSDTTMVASNNLANFFFYSRTGMASITAAGQWTLCDERRNPFGRVIAMETTGRASIQKNPGAC